MHIERGIQVTSQRGELRAHTRVVVRLVGVASLEEIAALVEPTLGGMGFELVQLRLLPGRRPTLQLLAEPLERGRPMTVEDCAAISHAVSAVLDVADPIASSYRLEVSSPGIDRPLTKREHFERFTGERALVELEAPVGGRRRFRGTLRGVRGEEVLMEVAGEMIALPLGGVRRARLVGEAFPGRGGRPGHRRHG